MRHAIATFLLLTGCAMTPSPDDAASLAEAERDFAAQSMRTDMASAFLANFSHDGVLVRDGWTPARIALAGRPPPPIHLDWAPSHVELAASGELGLSTGPWIRTSRVDPRAAAGHGHFVSIWRREPAGRWQVEVDIGISHPEAVPLGSKAEAIAPREIAPAAETLERAEARFVEASLRGGPRAAYEAHALPRLLLYREGHVPYRGKGAALEPGVLPATPTLWLADAVVVSRSDDFGYVRGTYADAAAPERVRGYFLRVWRREGATWAVALDVTNAAR